MTDEALISAGAKEIEHYVREVPGFPQKGISFKDITPLLEGGIAFHAAVDGLAQATQSMNYDRILSADARGFVLGGALAYQVGKGLILARNPDRLPRKTISTSYDLEYGSNGLEVHADSSIPAGARVLVVDDLLATGATACAMCQLVESSGGIVAGVTVLIELSFLSGRELLIPYKVASLLTYDE
jgi:adenine phosphoribosyltransferase